MPNFDWKTVISNVITEVGGVINTSDETKVNFTMKENQYMIDFENPIVVLSKVSDGSIVAKFPRIPPLIMVIFKNTLKKIN